MSAELSKALTAAPAKRAANISVELPGPQPTSMTERASMAGKAASKSRTGRVRSSSNCTYCRADQVTAAEVTAAEVPPESEAADSFTGITISQVANGVRW